MMMRVAAAVDPFLSFHSESLFSLLITPIIIFFIIFFFLIKRALLLGTALCFHPHVNDKNEILRLLFLQKKMRPDSTRSDQPLNVEESKEKIYSHAVINDFYAAPLPSFFPWKILGASGHVLDLFYGWFLRLFGAEDRERGEEGPASKRILQFSGAKPGY